MKKFRKIITFLFLLYFFTLGIIQGLYYLWTSTNSLGYTFSVPREFFFGGFVIFSLIIMVEILTKSITEARKQKTILVFVITLIASESFLLSFWRSSIKQLPEEIKWLTTIVSLVFFTYHGFLQFHDWKNNKPKKEIK